MITLDDTMAKTENHKKRSNGQQVADPTPADAPPESLDKVRDILFGGQMRVVEGRLQGLEERILREQTALRSDFAKQFAEMDAFIKKEIQALTERQAAERTKRMEDMKTLAAEFKEALRGLEKRHLKLEEAAGLADADLRDQILQQRTALSADISQLSQRLSSELNRSVQELKAEKLDTATIASLLSDMASRLTGNGRGSAKNATRG